MNNTLHINSEQQPKILYIGNDQDSFVLLNTEFSILGFVVLRLDICDTLIDVLKEISPEIILVDHATFDNKTNDIIAHIKSHPIIQDIPLILIIKSNR